MVHPPWRAASVATRRNHARLPSCSTRRICSTHPICTALPSRHYTTLLHVTIIRRYASRPYTSRPYTSLHVTTRPYYTAYYTSLHVTTTRPSTTRPSTKVEHVDGLWKDPCWSTVFCHNELPNDMRNCVLNEPVRMCHGPRDRPSCLKFCIVTSVEPYLKRPREEAP